MTRAEELIQAYATNTWLIGQLTTGFNEAESLLQPPFPTNCVNWLLGHILVSRDEAAQLCGGNLWDGRLVARYQSESEPVQVGDRDIHPFEDLLHDLQTSQDLLADLIDKCGQAGLGKPVETRRGLMLCWQHIRGLHWHETYHIGQLELLRSFILSSREGV